MASEVTYVCDICNSYKSTNIDDFRVLSLKEKIRDSYITYYLCEEKCFKLYKMVWKLLNKLNSDWNFTKLDLLMDKMVKEIEKD